MGKGSVSQSLLHGQLVVHEIGASGPRAVLQTDILCFLENLELFSAPRSEKGWEPLG
jgi:hypothetical protein